MTPNRDRGIIDTPSNHSVDETVEKLKGILQAKGVTLFALVDHSGEAEKVGMKMRPTKLLIFGNPKAGTPVMLAAPSSAIDLPLKILIWEDREGKVWVSYNSLTYLQERHGLPHGVAAKHRGSRNIGDEGCGIVNAISVSVEEVVIAIRRNRNAMTSHVFFVTIIRDSTSMFFDVPTIGVLAHVA